MRTLNVIAVISLLCFIHGCGSTQEQAPADRAEPVLLLELPDYCNTPDGCTLTGDGDIILSIPNFNNKALLEAGTIDAPAPAILVTIDTDNRLATWYEFTEKDLHPDTKKVGPMGCDIGPDGNLYVADNQVFFDGNNKSRLLRISIENGKAVRCDPVVEGFVVSNAVIWRGDTVYVSETILKQPPAVEEGQPPPSLTSGVYAVKISEWENGPVVLKPWSPEASDPHLIATYTTSGRIGFGADGLTFDSEGNLYCGIFEDGTIYKTSFNEDGSVKQTTVFAKDPKMACCDGIFWREADNKIYVADMLRNGVQVVDSDGKVTTLHTNGDTDGAGGLLDQPCEVIVRGGDLIIINMDMPFESDLLTNTKIDKPYTISVIKL